MAPEQQEPTTLPTWLREILADRQSSGKSSQCRAEVRRHWGRTSSVTHDSVSGEPLTVYGLNVCSSGLAFISRQKFTEGDMLTLTHPLCRDEPLCVSVVHCTDTLIGYHVGVTIEQMCPPEVTAPAECKDAARHCQHLTKDGSPCKMPPLRGRDVCFVHCQDEDVVARRARARRRADSTRLVPEALTGGGPA